MNNSGTVVRNLLVIWLFLTAGWSECVDAQDLEPRRWSHLPTGLNIIGMGYAYTDAFVYFNPAFKITDAQARINGFGFSAIRSFDLAGKSARISLMVPYASGRWQGFLEDEFRTVRRHGAGDPRLRLSVNLYGAPALRGKEYFQYRAEHVNNTVVGASLAVTLPLGQYFDDLLINIGNNRWSVRPQLGVVHTRGPWSFELTGSAFWFSKNDSFLEQSVLEQKPMYAMQGHVIYNFKPGIWASLSTAYGMGGRISVDGSKTSFEVDNWLWAASFGFPVGKAQSLKVAWLSGRTQNDVGRDSDNLLLSWSMRWTNE